MVVTSKVKGIIGGSIIVREEDDVIRTVSYRRGHGFDGMKYSKTFVLDNGLEIDLNAATPLALLELDKFIFLEWYIGGMLPVAFDGYKAVYEGEGATLGNGPVVVYIPTL